MEAPQKYMIQMSGTDSYQLLADRYIERRQQDEETIRLVEKHPRCAILPFPEKLDESIGSPGSDKTDTLRDFDLTLTLTLTPTPLKALTT